MFNKVFNQIEELIAESSKSNTEIIGQITQFIGDFDNSKLNSKYLGNLQKSIFSDAINSIITLNINYAKGLMEIGVELSKKLNNIDNQDETQSSIFNPPSKSSLSAFELSTKVSPGEVAEISFLLNSDKEMPIICNIQNDPFYFESDGVSDLYFNIHYSPQLFKLIKGIAQRVDAKIVIPVGTKPGIYRSKITVAGFEHTYFDLLVEILEKPFEDQNTHEESVVKKTNKQKNYVSQNFEGKAIKPKVVQKTTSTQRSSKKPIKKTSIKKTSK